MEEPQLIIDATARAEVVETLADRLRAHYVFPQVAEEMERVLRQHMSSGAYDALNEGESFAKTLTHDIYEVSKDKHLRVLCSIEALPLQVEGEMVDEDEWSREWGPVVNFGFEKVERLAGNVGYLNLRAFFSPRFAAEIGIAAMNLLANMHALIIDLRMNHGGDPEMIALLTSYLFDEKLVHLNSLYWRSNESTQQFWTLPYVPGKRYGKQKPVYVLISGETFSGAEEFTYNLKNLKRATIIGEITGGGAHPGDEYRLSAHFQVFIPGGRAINPVSGTNWEGTGVQPDIAASREEAFNIAYKMALKQVLESIGEPSTPPQGLLVREIQQALAEQESASVGV